MRLSRDFPGHSQLLWFAYWLCIVLLSPSIDCIRCVDIMPYLFSEMGSPKMLTESCRIGKLKNTWDESIVHDVFPPSYLYYGQRPLGKAMWPRLSRSWGMYQLRKSCEMVRLITTAVIFGCCICLDVAYAVHLHASKIRSTLLFLKAV